MANSWQDVAIDDGDSYTSMLAWNLDKPYYLFMAWLAIILLLLEKAMAFANIGVKPIAVRVGLGTPKARTRACTTG